MGNADYVKSLIAKLPTKEVVEILSEKQKKDLTLELVAQIDDSTLERVNFVPSTIKDLFGDFLDSLGDGGREYEGLQTGITQIDSLLGGLSKFVLCAGMAGVGKSSLALQLALGVAKNERIPVVYYSFEMEAREVITMAIQSKAKMQRKDILLRGQQVDNKKLIDQGIQELNEVSDLFYIVDSSTGTTPDITDMKAQVSKLQEKHASKRILVVIDSVQDIVPIEANQTQAEAKIAQQLVELQQQTGATILAIAQKNKAGVSSGGGYASVMGSVAFIHKPTTVIELIGGKEAISKARAEHSMTESEANEQERALAEKTLNPDTPYPVYLNVIKGRNSGYGGVSLKYYGAYRRYEVGQDEAWDELNRSVSEIFGITTS